MDVAGGSTLCTTPSGFDAKAVEWQRYTETPLGRLRQELTLYHLLQRLTDASSGLSVLDAGAGTGGYAWDLARHGHRVTLVDQSPAMLALARDQIAAKAPAYLEQAEFCCAPIDEATRLCAGRRFDVILVHTLLEYLDHPMEVLAGLMTLLASGGVISLLVANGAALALRWALAKADPERALVALHEQVAPADLFDGLPRRLLDLESILETLRSANVVQLEYSGIRIFADYGPPERLENADYYASLWRLELAASTLDPYRGIARYHHILGQKA